MASACCAREQALVDGVDGEADRGLGRALGAARLEHVEAVALDGELDVLHVAVVGLERAQDAQQLGVGLGQLLGQFVQRARRAHAGDDVLALRVEQEVAAGLGRAGQLVARERDARRRAGAEVAEHHLLDVDRRAPVVRDVVDAAVGHRAVAQPGVEDGADGEAQLLLRILGERLAGVDLVERAEAARDLAHVVHAQLAVLAHAGALPGRGEDLLVALARDAAHDVAEHLDEAPVGVPREALVARVRGQAQHRLVIETEVQDRLEHARHRVARAGAHRHEQRVVGVAERAARCAPRGGRRPRPPARPARPARYAPACMNATHASVVIVKPAGTRSGPSTRVISAMFAPLPPSSTRMSREPSVKSYT